MDFLSRHRFRPCDLVYCDPPYVMEARRSQKLIYRHEFTADDHRWLLRLVRKLPCLVMVSGYASRLYARELGDWRLVTFTTTTRGGAAAVEHLWCNFSEPAALHDPRYLGADYRERERIRRKAQRWRRRLAALAPLERQAVLSAALADFSEGRSPGPLAISGDGGQRVSPAPAMVDRDPAPPLLAIGS